MLVDIHDAKRRLSALVEKACRGETVVIARAGQPSVELLPYKPRRQRSPGRFKGQICVSTAIDRTSVTLLDAFEGEA